MSHGLSKAATLQLFAVINEQLRTSSLPTPAIGEGEEAFTDKYILPIIERVAAASGVAKLLVGGHHTGINRPVMFLGFEFHPDVLVIYSGHRLLAYEVKFLASGDRSGATSKAIGQATIYGMQGYAAAGALLLDTLGVIGKGRLGKPEAHQVSTFAIVARSASGAEFRTGETSYG